MEKQLQAKERGKAKLRDFIENNQKLISILGIFAALAALSNTIPIKDFGQFLSLPCLGAVILLWVEVIRQMPDEDEREFPLTLFFLLISMLVVVLAAYLFIEYRDLWRILVPIAVMIILLALTAPLVDKLQHRLKTWNKFHNFVARNARLATLFGVLSISLTLLLAYIVAVPLSLPLIRVLDWVDDAITKSEFAHNREKDFPIRFEFAPGKYCCYRAQAAGTTCRHTCCRLARIDGTFCKKCVPEGHASLKPNAEVHPRSADQINTDSNKTGTVTIVIEATDSEIFIDGNFLGNGSVKLPLSVGKHLLVVTKPGYADYRRELAVIAGAQLKVHPVLERERNSTKPAAIRTNLLPTSD